MCKCVCFVASRRSQRSNMRANALDDQSWPEMVGLAQCAWCRASSVDRKAARFDVRTRLFRGRSLRNVLAVQCTWDSKHTSSPRPGLWLTYMYTRFAPVAPACGSQGGDGLGGAAQGGGGPRPRVLDQGSSGPRPRVLDQGGSGPRPRVLDRGGSGSGVGAARLTMTEAAPRPTRTPAVLQTPFGGMKARTQVGVGRW